MNFWGIDMAGFKVHAGDFGKGEARCSFGQITFAWKPGDGFSFGETVAAKEIIQIDVATEDSVKKIGGTIGWGAAGAVILGPVGLLAGLLLGGRKTEVTFVAEFKDGRKMLATADSKTYTSILASSFK